MFFTIITSPPANAQDSIDNRTREISQEFYEESLRHKIIPDKVFEVGTVFLMVFLVANTIVTLFKVYTERRLKEKALDKGISEGTMRELFRQDKNMVKNNSLKWFLVLASLGLSFIYIHLLDQYIKMSSGFLAMGITSLLVSVAFFIYYRIIRKQD